MNKALKFGALAVFVGAVTGCANSLQDAGMTRVRVATPNGTVVEIDLGKEYEQFEATLTWVDNRPVVSISATGVRAFEGQALAAAVAIEIQRQISERIRLGVAVTVDEVSAITNDVLGSMIPNE